LMAQSFDPVAVRLAGQPAVVLEGVNFYDARHAGQFTVSDSGLLVYETEQVLPPSQLTWFDMEGNRIGTIGAPSAINGVKISHDGKTAAAVVVDASSRPDIWLYDLQRGGARRFTFEEGGEQPAWSPDDREIAYLPTNGGVIRFKPVGEGGKSREAAEKYAEVGQFSPDGGLLSVFIPGDKGSLGLGVVPTRGEPRIRSLVGSNVSKATFTSPFSPNGRWIGYISSESGRDELYVVPSSGAGGKWQVTSNGVVWATWPWQSKEIFFVQPPDSKLFAVEVGFRDGNIEISSPRQLFGGKPLPFGMALDVTADGKRILIAQPSGQSGTHPLTLVTNWTERLARK
jgi:hypothetical protein